MPITCPYCNTPLAGQIVTRKADKVVCPRCGEPLPPALVRALPETSAEAPEPLPYRKPLEANRRVIRLVLGGMGVIAAVALLFALVTQSQRRARDPKKPEPIPQPPGELAALRFLPPQTNLALGLHVADILYDPDASTLLKEPRPALLDLVLELVRAKTALGLRDIDHLVLGTTLESKLPTLVLVVQTHKPYALGDVKKAMHPAEPASHLAQPLFRFSTAPLGEAFLWCKAPRTLIFLWRPDSVDKKDLDLIPKGDAVGAKALPIPLRDFITTRLEKQSLLWLVGDLEPLVQLQGSLDPLRGVLPWLKTMPRLPEPWKSVKFAGLSVVNETKKEETPRALTLRAQFQTPTETTADRVEAALKEIALPGQISNTVTGPAPEGMEDKERWVLWQARSEVEGLRQWIGGLGKK